ncbi:ribosomal protein RPP1 [Blastocystis sp. subtype 4]|uniref:ribosomal protein RPP1 n=1 Tax=Blastocystis sp. subtype 4 TaxID=944170 RepID=UPI000711F4D3|nr:ribosomal protein RPP1 [Blastocystis sp. subtype 4]KNB42221.1 ribosomal protein RPP1 [Blastocystis sp. subtype 4]|eukprot:XP_014525664.1 ribosomal protein RPP1 [Blastocystis sp. subtype 4]
MAPFENMSTVEKEELAISLAALICADAKVELTKDNLDKLVKASGNTIAPYWSMVFASNLAGKDLLDMIAAPGVGAAAPAAGTAPAAEEKKEEEAKEEEEEEDIDMSGGGLFGDDDDDW